MFRFAFFVVSIIGYFVCVFSQENLIWARIPKFYVDDSVNNFLNHRQIINCYYKFEDDDTFLLKCWRNNKLVDVEISIKEKRQKMFDEYIST